MAEQVTGQVSKSAADVYEEFFVPALFQDWADVVSKAANLSPNQHVLDVACGTGVLARAANKSVQPGGAVTGLDLNEGMITTARRMAPNIEWQVAPAEQLPFEEASFDAVVSQFGLMFFENRKQGIAEMWRVLKPGGQLTVAVWDTLENSPGYAAITSLLKRLFGDKIADELRMPYSMGDKKLLADLFGEAGVTNPIIETMTRTSRYPSVEQWMHMDVKGWTIGDMINDEQYEQLIVEAHKDMKQFVQPDGQVFFPSPAHIVTATRSG